MGAPSPFLALLVIVAASACGSSNEFSVANPGGDDTGSSSDSASNDTTPGSDTSPGSDTTPSDDTTPPPIDARDGSSLDGIPSDVISSDVPLGDGISSDSITVDAGGCFGTMCGSACVDENTDPKNCGGCGNAVCHGEVCSGGSRACSPGWKACGAMGCLGCRNVSSDPNSCGDCSKKCAIDETCVDGTCKTLVTSCPTGQKKCTPTSGSGGSWCANLNVDFSNCGSCGKSCAPGQYCAGGSCVDYTSAPGCASCPCAFCSSKSAKCCTYAGAPVCASACQG